MEKEEILKLIDERVTLAIEAFKKELSGSAISGQPSRPTQSISIKSFVDAKNPRRSSSEEMPVMAYYLREFDTRKMNEVDENAMRVAYRFSDRVAPKNIKQAFIDNPFLVKIPKKVGLYMLNKDGDSFVNIVLEERKNKNE